MQGRFSVPLPTTTPRACVVCAAPVDGCAAPVPRKGAAPSAQSYPLCREPSCRFIFEQVGDVPEAEFLRQLKLGAERWRLAHAKKRRGEEEFGRLVREQRVAEARGNAAAFAAIGPRADLGPEPTLQLVVPSGHGSSRPLSKRRRRAYAAHLDAIIAAATAPAPPAQPSPVPEALASPAPQAANSSLPGRLCGACGGGCCPIGKDQAFLSETTIRRVMAADPSLDPARLREIYLGHLAQRTLPGSCINHTRLGCSLPRELRSDICNAAACDVLVSLEDGLKADPPVRKVVVLRRRQNFWYRLLPPLNNDIVGAAVLTETKATRLRAPKPAD
jgi:hypothetical protein